MKRILSISQLEKRVRALENGVTRVSVALRAITESSLEVSGQREIQMSSVLSINDQNKIDNKKQFIGGVKKSAEMSNLKTAKPGFEWAPFQAIPNCRDFKIELGNYSSIFKHFGLHKREGTVIVVEKGNNAHVVKYAKAMISRLRKTDSDEKY
jgi:hypothetical protein